MPAIASEDLIAYVLGEASPESAATIRAEAENDSELAATLELLGHCGAIAATPKPSVPLSRSLAPAWRRWTLAATVLLAVCGLSWAGLVLLKEPALLEDHFESNWGDLSKWRTPRRGVFAEDGHLRLFDRGYLVTENEFSGPIELTFKWRWTDLVGDFLYRDELSVALRTSGVPRDEWSHEVSDGVIVKLNVTVGSVRIVPAEELKAMLDRTDDSSVPFPAAQWHSVRITDDGETIAVYVHGPAVAGDPSRPIATATIKREFPYHHIAFYNRERLASASHESWVDDVVVRKMGGAERR